MNTLQDLSSWLQQLDPLIKAVGIVAAAAGGIWVWHKRYRDRTQVRIRKLRLAQGDTTTRKISFEAENIGTSVTSLEPSLSLTAYSPERRRQRYCFVINEKDRQLPVLVSKQFIATHNEIENRVMLFVWFMTFRIPLTRSNTVTVRVRNADFKPIGFWRFHIARLFFLAFGPVHP